MRQSATAMGSNSNYPDYDNYLERGSSGSPSAQPNGVSEDSRNEGWSHRTEMADQGSVQFEEQRSTSQNVNDRDAGEVVRMEKKDHGKCGGKSSNENDDALVEDRESLNAKEKAAKEYGDHWPDSKKREFLEQETDLEAEALGWDIE